MNELAELSNTSGALEECPMNELAGFDVTALAQNPMNKLSQFRNASNATAQNQLLFEWLSDDLKRKELYEELHERRIPALRFKSLLTSKQQGKWQKEDVYLLLTQQQVEEALRHYSVEPYRSLDSGGEFMLGLDARKAHDRQRGFADSAFDFTTDELDACALAAFQRAAVRPLKSRTFDLTEVAEQAAVHFITLLFGFRNEAHALLNRLALGAYGRLVFQIIGRHFVSSSDSGLRPSKSPEAEKEVEKVKEALAAEIKIAANATGYEPFREGAPKKSVIKRLRRLDAKDQAVIVAGLIAGTVGNIRAAVPIVIYDFFTHKDDDGTPLIDKAQKAARTGAVGLEDLIWEALLRNPPAAFLARTATPISDKATPLKDGIGPIPEGAHLLLAVGADPKRKFVFGGYPGFDGDPEFVHNCVGARLAWRLIVAVVRQVLQLPGLSQLIEPTSGKPFGLKKQWGVISQPYKLHYQRDRRLNQQRLYVVLPIKEPVQDNAKKLTELTRAGAHIVEAALKESGIVHFAWFMLVENETKLSLSTVFDGDFDAYVEHFAVKVPLFDKQFEYLDVVQKTPIRDHPKQFVENIRKYNKAPLVDYFYSAYPTLSVADIENATTKLSDEELSDDKLSDEKLSDEELGDEELRDEELRDKNVGDDKRPHLENNQLHEVQRLALSGYPFDLSDHLILKVTDADKARAFIADLLQPGGVTFSDRDDTDRAINIGFTYHGLQALGVPDPYLQQLQNKAGAFCEGARSRAAHRLGDTGPSAAERWDPMFGTDDADVVISIHGEDRRTVNSMVKELMESPDAREGFDAHWKSSRIPAKHLDGGTDPDGRKIRLVHFGYRDNIARPIIAREDVARSGQCHNPGELLLGYLNDENFNRWDDGQTSADVTRFFRNGSFAAFRKIQQHEDKFNEFLHEQVARFEEGHPHVTADYLKAKMCGRWLNGAPVKPGFDTEPKLNGAPPDDFDFKDDSKGFGCPFGAHIRRTNPREDPIRPMRKRPLFRRGMPYGPGYEVKEDEERGLLGLFFCASLEDQFEHVMLEWVEKKPMGPPDPGNAKDPLIGQHDEVASIFRIPQQNGADIELPAFKQFVTTRGTLYLLFPSLTALREIAGIPPQGSAATEPLVEHAREICSAFRRR